MNNFMGETKCMFYIIVKFEDGNEQPAHQVWKTSVRFLLQEPVSYEEALIKQHPDIEKLMEKLARDLVICGIEDNSDELKTIFSEKINAAVTAQASLVNKATWRNVGYYNQGEANQKANQKANQC